MRSTAKSDRGARRPRKRLGVVGTLVWDTIRPWRTGRRPPSEEAWGGIAYALTAFDHALPDGWTVVPVLKIGRDVAPRAMALLRSFARIGDVRFVRVVAEPNNRVELVYHTRAERVEILTGGVPGWSPGELEAVLPTLDALYVNFISGVELDLSGAVLVRDRMIGPAYADLHSLFLDIDRDGRRTPRYLPSSTQWVRCFDAVQMNETEFGLFARGATDPWRAAARAMTGRLRTIVVTLGAAGAQIMTKRASDTRPARETAPISNGAQTGDPTGCGDVWGATFFASILDGAGRQDALLRANAVAGCALGSTGAEGLREALAVRERARERTASGTESSPT